MPDGPELLLDFAGTLPTPAWTWCAAPGAARDTKLAVDINAFGDGYIHRSTRGLNPIRPSWNLQFPFGLLSDLQGMDQFLQTYAAGGFWFAPPDDNIAVFVTCDEWVATVVDRAPGHGDHLGNLTATFTRAFNPQSTNNDSDFLSWQAAVITAGGTVSAQQASNVNWLIRSFKAEGIYQRLNRLYLLRAANTQQALCDLITKTMGTPVGAPTFVANNYYKFNGTNQAINSGYVATGLGPYLLNDASMGVVVATAAQQTNNGFVCGNNDAAYSFIRTRLGTQRAVAINQTVGGTPYTPSPAAYDGWFHAQRTSASSVALYRQGVLEVAQSTPSGVLAPFAWCIGSNTAGAPSNFSDAGIMAAYIGGSLTAAQIASVYQILGGYLTAPLP